MTSQAPNSTAKKITMAAVDAGTLVLCAAFTTAASYAGPVVTGISVAVTMLPCMFAFSGLLNRRFPLPDTVSDEDVDWINKTGLQRTWQGLKNIYNDTKRGNFLKAFAAAGMMGTVGLFATYVTAEAQEMTEKAEEFQKLPILPANTLIRADEICGLKRDISFNTPFTHNGTQYRINCP